MIRMTSSSSISTDSAQARPTDGGSDFSRYLETAFKACDGASQILNSHFGHLRNLDEKFQAGLVSDADRESENYIINFIRKTFPEHSFLGEESGLSAASKGDDSTSPLASSAASSASPAESAQPLDRDPQASGNGLWIIDPLDGTTNFVHQFPFFAISLGLELNGQLVLGVVDAPKLGLRFHAVKGGGAFLNGQPIRVSSRDSMRDGLFATGFSGYDNTLDEQLELLAFIVKATRGIRRAGAAALDMCFVAQGIFDVFWEKNLSPWDTAAGTVIAREAGGLVTDMGGRPFDPRMKSVLCGNPKLHGETLKIMKQIRKRHGRS